MTANNRMLATIALVVGGVALLFKYRESQLMGQPFLGPILAPGNPSTAAPANIGAGTNLFMMIPAALERAVQAFKMPGNTSSIAAKPIQPGLSLLGWTVTPQDSLIPPPPLNPMYGEAGAFLPNFGDPNMGAWDQLASTPPDLAWTLTPDMSYIPPPPGSDGTGVPDLAWTIRPEDSFIPPPPGTPQTGRIYVSGLS